MKLQINIEETIPTEKFANVKISSGLIEVDTTKETWKEDFKQLREEFMEEFIKAKWEILELRSKPVSEIIEEKVEDEDYEIKLTDLDIDDDIENLDF